MHIFLMNQLQIICKISNRSFPTYLRKLDSILLTNPVKSRACSEVYVSPLEEPIILVML